MSHQLIQLVVAVAILLIAWWCVERFSPDPLITKICQVIIFVLALAVIVTKILPMVGVSF